MWVFLNDAMLSAVAAERRGFLVVRARCRGDLERAFRHVANLKVAESPPERDYRFRTEVTREAFAAALAGAVQRIDYRNFKDSVREPDRHDAYLGAWRAMYRLQERRHGPGIYSAGYHAAKAQSDFGDLDGVPEWTPPGRRPTRAKGRGR